MVLGIFPSQLVILSTGQSYFEPLFLSTDGVQACLSIVQFAALDLQEAPCLCTMILSNVDCNHVLCLYLLRMADLPFATEVS